MYCCISAGTTGSWAPGVTCGRKDFSFGFEHQLETGDISSNDKSYCVAKTTDTNAVKLCNTLGKSVGPWNNNMSPQGIKNGYTWRKLD